MPLFSLAYWTSLLPPATIVPGFLYALLAIFGGLIAAAIVLRVLSSRKKESLYWTKGVRRLSNAFVWMGLLGLLHLWFAYEQVYLWGARFWLLVWGAGLLFWIARVAKYMTVDLAEEAADHAEKYRIQKYLPKKR